MVEKPVVKLVGEDGNIFNLLGIASRALYAAKLDYQVREMQTQVFACGSYDEALQIIMKYVEVE